jgi:hypothetical protein
MSTGHANITITLTLYAHVLPGMDKNIAAALDGIIDR